MQQMNLKLVISVVSVDTSIINYSLHVFTDGLQKKICKIQFASFFLLFLHIISAVSAFFIGRIEKFMQ